MTQVLLTVPPVSIPTSTASVCAQGVLFVHPDRAGCSIALRAVLRAALTAGRRLPQVEVSVSLSVAAGSWKRIVAVVSVVLRVYVDIDGIGLNIDLEVLAPDEHSLI